MAQQLPGDLLARLQTTATVGKEAQKATFAHAVCNGVLALACGQSLIIIDVATTSVVATLDSQHSEDVVKLCWSPWRQPLSRGSAAARGPAFQASESHWLASVDIGGKLNIWDIPHAAITATCRVATDGRRHTAAPAVVDMAWATRIPDMLVLLLEPATVVLVNAESGVMVLSHNLLHGSVLTCLEVDPTDCSRLALTSMSGALVVAQFGNSMAESPSVLQFAIPFSGLGLFKAMWTEASGIILLLYTDCFVVYDVSMQAVLERVPLPPRCRPFKDWICIEPVSASMGLWPRADLSTIVIEHEDAGISIWHSAGRPLEHSLLLYFNLAPSSDLAKMGFKGSVCSVMHIPRPMLHNLLENTECGQAVQSAPQRRAQLAALMASGEILWWTFSLPAAPPPVLFSPQPVEGETAPLFWRHRKKPSINLRDVDLEHMATAHSSTQLDPFLATIPSPTLPPRAPSAPPFLPPITSPSRPFTQQSEGASTPTSVDTVITPVPTFAHNLLPMPESVSPSPMLDGGDASNDETPRVGDAWHREPAQAPEEQPLAAASAAKAPAKQPAAAAPAASLPPRPATTGPWLMSMEPDAAAPVDTSPPEAVKVTTTTPRSSPADWEMLHSVATVPEEASSGSGAPPGTPCLPTSASAGGASLTFIADADGGEVQLWPSGDASGADTAAPFCSREPSMVLDSARSGGVATHPSGVGSTAGGLEMPELQGLTRGLSAPVVTLSVLPVLLPVGEMLAVPRLELTCDFTGQHPDGAAADELPTLPTTIVPAEPGCGGGSGGSERDGVPVVSLLALATSTGYVDVAAVRRGALQPLALDVVRSFKVAGGAVASVQWLGSTLRFATMTSVRMGKAAGQPPFHNTVQVIDLVSTRKQIVMDEPAAQSALIALRASPCGRYLLIMPRKGSTQLWCVPVVGGPVKIRSILLPFVALAWFRTTEEAYGPSKVFSPEMELAAWAPHSGAELDDSTSLPSQNSLHRDPGLITGVSSPITAQLADHHDEKSHSSSFVFAVSDGRLGAIEVSDKGAKKRSIVAPHWSVQYTDELVVTSITAVGNLVFIGDSNGVLYQWDTSTGKTHVLPCAKRAVRRMAVAPPAPDVLCPLELRHACSGRMMIVFADGKYGVWDISPGKIHTCSTLPSFPCASRIVDTSWLPLPGPASTGTVAVLLVQGGSILLVDVAQPIAYSPKVEERVERLKGLLAAAHTMPGADANPVMGQHSARAQPAVKLLGPHAAEALGFVPVSVRSVLHLVLQTGLGVAVVDGLASTEAEQRAAAVEQVVHHLCHKAQESMRSKKRGLEAGMIDVFSAEHVERMGLALQKLATQRFGPKSCGVLSPLERRYYTATLPDSPHVGIPTVTRMCNRAALAATICGNPIEAFFWVAMPGMREQHRAVCCTPADQGPLLCATTSFASPPSNSPACLLFSDAALVDEAEQRLSWYETASHQEEASQEDPHARADGSLLTISMSHRILRYIAVGDYVSSVELAMPALTDAGEPNFYRTSLLTVALALAGTDAQGTAQGAPAPRPHDFHVQALKVVAEHARGAGDEALAVVLLCAARLYLQAVHLLQACGGWRLALTLAARVLPTQDRLNFLQDYAAELHDKASSHSAVWRSASLYAAADRMWVSAEVLEEAGYGIAAHALLNITTSLGLDAHLMNLMAYTGGDGASTAPRPHRASASSPAPRSVRAGPDLINLDSGLDGLLSRGSSFTGRVGSFRERLMEVDGHSGPHEGLGPRVGSFSGRPGLARDRPGGVNNPVDPAGDGHDAGSVPPHSRNVSMASFVLGSEIDGMDEAAVQALRMSFFAWDTVSGVMQQPAW